MRQLSVDGYPMGEPGVIDLGDRHFAIPFRTETTDCYLWWHDCARASAWCWVGPLEVVTSHAPLTVRGPVMCPSGCGERGFIEAGRWRPEATIPPA